MRFVSVRVKSFLFAALIATLIGCAYTSPQVAQQAQQVQRAPVQKPANKNNPDDAAISHPTSEPYTGDLSIFEDPQRERKLQINRVMDLLQIKENSTVADIGAGSGWFTTRAARRVGANGKVFAVEVNQDYIKHINERAVKEKLANIQTVLGKEDDPLLPANALDAVLILKTYHEIAQPVRLLQHLHESMKTGSLLGIIDRNGKGDDHGLNKDVVIDEAKRAGFSLVEQYDFVKADGMDYFLVLRPVK